MGFFKKLILGRWFTRWLLRGGPWGVAAKLAGVALWGIWKWRREQRAVESEQRAREIPAEYEVVEAERRRLANLRRPPSGEPREEPEPHEG